MTGCSAPNCSNQSKTCRMFRFPNRKKDKERWKLWVINCNRYNWEPSDNSRLCKEHFEEEEFDRGTNCDKESGVKMLRKDAIPTLFKTSNPLLRTRSSRTQMETSRNKRIGSVRYSNDRKDGVTSSVFLHNDHEYSMKAEQEVDQLKKQDRSYVSVSKNIGENHYLVFEPVTEGLMLLQLPKLVQLQEAASAEPTVHSGLPERSTKLPSFDKDMPVGSSQKLAKSLKEAVSHNPKQPSASLAATRWSESDRQIRLLRLELQKTRRKLWRVNKLFAAEKKRNVKLKESLNVFCRPDQIAALSNKKANSWSRETLDAGYKLLFSCGTRGYNTILSQGFPLPSHRTLLRRVQQVSSDPSFDHEFDCVVGLSSCEESAREKEDEFSDNV